jgi:hypothetical protein
MKLTEDIVIHRHVPRMIIVTHDLCKNEKKICKKNEEQRCPIVGWRAKALGWN